MNFILIALGGSLGALARHSMASLIQTTLASTLIVNVLGCFFSGVLVTYLARFSHAQLALLLVVGFLGSFTTYSTFNHQLISMLDESKMLLAFYYISTQILLGLGAFMLGRYLITFFINK